MRCFVTNATKSCGVYRDKAERQKCGFCDRKFAGLAYTFVKLQRPPPEMRIFSPIVSAWSISATFRPRCPARAAQNSPAAPAPIMIASKCGVVVMA